MSVVLEKERLPRHVAVIMDGNGRWALQRGFSRIEGHKRGKAAVQAIVEAAAELKLEYLTLYAFSTENWQRPVSEVRALMSLLRRYLRTELHRLMKNRVRLLAIGDLSRLPMSVQKELDYVIRATQENTGLTVVLAVSYGGREEIIAAARAMVSAAIKGRLTPQDINESAFTHFLWTANIPDPDLLIRTSGEFRLSNFLLWQLAYTEIYVTDTLWPDFDRGEFFRALADYQGRERRFGRTAEQQPALELRSAAR